MYVIQSVLPASSNAPAALATWLLRCLTAMASRRPAGATARGAAPEVRHDTCKLLPVGSRCSASWGSSSDLWPDYPGDSTPQFGTLQIVKRHQSDTFVRYFDKHSDALKLPCTKCGCCEEVAQLPERSDAAELACLPAW